MRARWVAYLHWQACMRGAFLLGLQGVAWSGRAVIWSRTCVVGLFNKRVATCAFAACTVGHTASRFHLVASRLQRREPLPHCASRVQLPRGRQRSQRMHNVPKDPKRMRPDA